MSGAKNTLEPIVIKDYDPRWQILFQEEKALLMEEIGHYVAEIQHIGSTAVEGLAAKPVIDIMIGLRRILDSPDCIMPIEAMGYEYHPEFEDEFPERRYFRKMRGTTRTHQIHMVEIDTDFWKRHLRFRDYLRANPESAQEYATLKRGLAEEHTNDREAYTNAKSEFIQEILLGN
ncbi:MAG: GrpB family protein [bacterium]